MPEISIIVPVYNVEKYLRRCIDSILNQTFTDFELILVDDGSPDRCPAICDEYAADDNRIRVIHQVNAGQAAARNRALDIAKGEYISFVDSDDFIRNDYLEILYCNIKQFNADISVCCHQKVSDIADLVIEKKVDIPKKWTGREFLLHCFDSNNGKQWVLWDKLYCKSCFKNIRLPEGRIYEDNAVVYKLLYEANIVADSDDILYFYFQREDSTMHQDFSFKHLDWLLVLEEMVRYFNKNHENELERIIDKRYLYALTDLYTDSRISIYPPECTQVKN